MSSVMPSGGARVLDKFHLKENQLIASLASEATVLTTEPLRLGHWEAIIVHGVERYPMPHHGQWRADP